MIRIAAAALAAALSCAPALAQVSPNAFIQPTNGNIPDAATHPRAVPTALGFGKNASARAANAVVYHINTSSDVVNEFDTLTTFRECVEARKQQAYNYSRPGGTTTYNRQNAITAEGLPRYCLFTNYVGYIAVASPLVVTHPKLFIAGSTALESGVEVTYAGTGGYIGTAALLEIKANDVIIQNLRIRGKPHVGAYASDTSNAILINGTAERIFLDHLSLAYTTDQVLAINSGKDVSVTNSIIGPMLCGEPGISTVGHSEDWHCRPNFALGAKNVTYAYNLVAYGEQRAFNFGAGQRDNNENPLPNQWGQIDVINNVSYYFRYETGLVSNRFGHTFANFVNNTMWRGPQYDPIINYPIGLYNKDPSSVGGSNTTGFSVYHSGNRTFRSTVAALTGQTGGVNFCGITPGSNPPTVDCTITGLGVVSTTTPAIAPENTNLSLDALDISTSVLSEKTVLTFAGAVRCVKDLGGAAGPVPNYCRNEIDTAIIGDYQTCDAPPWKFSTANDDANPWPNSRANAFGNDTLTSTYEVQDTDGDGMPDKWETAVGSTPTVANGNGDPDFDGYPNLEEYIAYTASAAAFYNIHRTGFASPLAVPPTNCGYAVAP